MTHHNDLVEVKGLGKGMGPPGAKMSKAMGMAGVNVSSKSKLVKKSSETYPKKTPVPKEPTGMTPQTAGEPQGGPESPEDVQAGAEQEVLDPGPEMVEKLPDPESMKFDKLGAPDKHHLIGHVVRWGSKEYVLDWDDEFEVYKIVDPETFRVKTRIRPDSISTVDYKAECIKDAVRMAIYESYRGVPVDQLIDGLLHGFTNDVADG